MFEPASASDGHWLWDYLSSLESELTSRGVRMHDDIVQISSKSSVESTGDIWSTTRIGRSKEGGLEFFHDLWVRFEGTKFLWAVLGDMFKKSVEVIGDVQQRGQTCCSLGQEAQRPNFYPFQQVDRNF